MEILYEKKGLHLGPFTHSAVNSFLKQQNIKTVGSVAISYQRKSIGFVKMCFHSWEGNARRTDGGRGEAEGEEEEEESGEGFSPHL